MFTAYDAQFVVDRRCDLRGSVNTYPLENTVEVWVNNSSTVFTSQIGRQDYLPESNARIDALPSTPRMVSLLLLL